MFSCCVNHSETIMHFPNHKREGYQGLWNVSQKAPNKVGKKTRTEWSGVLHQGERERVAMCGG